ncbi:hypothetical protein MNBD_GAMMA17-802 [hydrothermal vent metagenome]|uniref:Uncharacterized protein n=1 Tax=hydrothermal vent metagenome TaxID=652676 RepID=A0A3B0ZPD9_9ZZZZ
MFKKELHCDARGEACMKKSYRKPQFKKVGSLAELTQGFAGSVPDEQGGQTKRNPFQG